ncbi:DUF2894 domain-containing protein [Achromobacter sp. JUb104]|uniref:DUF2894 domain-containing protein n=1 Tax=Achromobacter sp. JUb104 TaxID=2940590 RepID=UPI0038577F80|nr:hypothetical protein [Achromobacter sp. JUb104]
MSSDGSIPGTLDAQAVLDAWREGGADRVDPVRFRFLQAMARRSAVLDGLARQLLDEKLAGYMNAYAQVLDAETDADADANPGAEADAEPNIEPNTPPPAEPANDAPSALAGLLAYLADPGAAPGQNTADGALWNRDALGLRDAYPDVQMLEYFRAVWSRVSADRQVRQSQQQVHKNAGPLNSNQLVHRALSLMRELSPGYLQQFLSYTDALMWMEQIHAATAPAPKDAARGAAKKSSRAKAR